ncbi:MAG: hypothetical protein R3F29_05440 [Planctomycetota bacterium]
MGAFVTSLSGQELLLLFLIALGLYAPDLPDGGRRVMQAVRRCWRSLLP